MPRNTRKNRSRKQKGGIWPFTSAPTPVQQAATQMKSAQEKAKYNMAHSKSRVSNFLAKPVNASNTTAQNRHEFTYTNKDRIQAELKEKIQKIESKLGVSHEEVLKGIEEGKNTDSSEMVKAVREIIAVLEAEIENVSKTNVGSAAAYGAKGSVLVLGTLTVFTAQLLLKAMRIWLALMVLFLLGLPFLQFGSLDLVSGILPNAGFNTTKSVFSNLKGSLFGNAVVKVESWN